MLDMHQRLRDMPIMAQRDDAIEARYYNVWRRARQRWGAPMRFPLPGLKQVAMILDDEFWVCVDSIRYDSPLLAWVEFADAGRDSLHLPIGCKLNYYHIGATAMRARALDLMQQLLNERLSR